MLSCFTIECVKHYAPDWFYCLTVYQFWAKSGKYHSQLKVCKINAIFNEYTLIFWDRLCYSLPELHRFLIEKEIKVSELKFNLP